MVVLYGMNLNYQKTLNVSVNLFGVEFQLENYQKKVYQRIFQLMFNVYQDEKTTYGLIFQCLIRNESDYKPQLNESLYGNVIDRDVEVEFIQNKLDEWHFVQLFYGILNNQPVQKMKIQFLDGSEFQKNGSSPIYYFDDRKLRIRSGSLFDISQDGVTAYSGLSKIYVCVLGDEIFSKCKEFKIIARMLQLIHSFIHSLYFPSIRPLSINIFILQLIEFSLVTFFASFKKKEYWQKMQCITRRPEAEQYFSEKFLKLSS